MIGNENEDGWSGNEAKGFGNENEDGWSGNEAR